MKSIKINDINLILGQNSKENHNIIDNADSNDWWFHLDDYPSGHCIIETSELTNELIINAANLVKENSKLKNNKKLKVVYLQVKNIKKTKNPGEVRLLNKGQYFYI